MSSGHLVGAVEDSVGGLERPRGNRRRLARARGHGGVVRRGVVRTSLHTLLERACRREQRVLELTATS